MYTVDHFGNEG